MSKVLTEVAADADFATGLTYPVNGESGTIWWDLIEGCIQQLADRTQQLELASPGSSPIKLSIPLTSALEGERFDYSGGSAGIPFWTQDLVTSGNPIQFPLDRLPPGIEIVSVSMIWSGGSLLGTTHAALPNTMPSIALYYNNITTLASGAATSLGSQTDPSTPVSNYNVMHEVTLTVGHTVVAGNNYTIAITGESGANAEINKSTLCGVFVTLGPA